MSSSHSLSIDQVRWKLSQGLVIPAHPLALNAARKLDERRQRALSRYYIEAGCGGLAVGVHTTQFAIHRPEIGLYAPVLHLAAEAAAEYALRPVLIAGVLGPTSQAVNEAEIAAQAGYDAVLLSLAGLRNWSESQLLAHCRAVGEILPIVGFYLQESVGGIPLPYSFWRRFVEIESVIAIKVAPFNRYATLNVARAVIEAGKQDVIALYTGNDDAILADLILPFAMQNGSGEFTQVHFAGGLLGHWAVWTHTANKIFARLRALVTGGVPIPHDFLSLVWQITDCNSAFFDANNAYQGCIAGLHEVLRRQGLLEGIWCIDPNECLSPGQMEEIDRVYRAYPHLNDDAFVAEHRDRWLS